MKRMIAILSVAFMIILPSVALAVPSFPNQFYGSVTYNGAEAPDGLTVTANIGGTEVGMAATDGGIYSIIVSDNDGRNSGKTVSFFVEGIDSGATTIYCSGCVSNVPLFVSGPELSSPSSGSSDSSDTAKNTGASGSGSGTISTVTTSSASESNDDDGESNTSDDFGDSEDTSLIEKSATITESSEDAVCIEKWVCTDWTRCDDGIRERKCADKNECGTEDRRPFESEPCSEEEDSANFITGLFSYMDSGRLAGISIAGLLGLIVILIIYVTNRNGASESPTNDMLSDEDDVVPKTHRKLGHVPSPKHTLPSKTKKLKVRT